MSLKMRKMKMKPKNEYEFSIVIRDADFSDLNVHDSLFESGCDDALICANNNTVYLQFTREANSAQEAILSALSDIKVAGFKDLIIEESSAITISEIANKAALTRQAIHNYVKGHRGDGNFPKPIAGLSSNNPLYDWYEVAQWLNNHNALSDESLEVAHVARKFNHNIPVSPILKSKAVTMNLAIRQTRPNFSEVMKCRGDNKLFHLNYRKSREYDILNAARATLSAKSCLDSFGKRSELYDGIHEVIFDCPDVEDPPNFSFLSAQR